MPEDRTKRVESERFHDDLYDDLVAHDEANLDITWLRDESLADSSNLPAPGMHAAEILEDLEAVLSQFVEVAASLPVSDIESGLEE